MHSAIKELDAILPIYELIGAAEKSADLLDWAGLSGAANVLLDAVKGAKKSADALKEKIR